MVNSVETFSGTNGMSLVLDNRKESTLIDVDNFPVAAPSDTVSKTKRHRDFLLVAQKTLHRRGISRDQIVSHPLPERPDDHFIDGAYNIYREFNSHSDIPYSLGQPTTMYSGRSSPVATDSETNHSMLSLSLGTTGNTTERSSIYSLGEDDFEQEATRRVRAMFEEIDAYLFEGNSSAYHLATECKQWVGAFPHLRILGKQVLPPQDMGFKLIPGDTPRSNTGNDLMDITENDLSVLGQHVQAHNLNSGVMSRLGHSPGGADLSALEEEIIEQDGSVEDIIALDFRSLEDDSRSHTTHRRRKRGLPPVTPQACVKDNISGAAFDFIWTESLSWWRSMMKQYANNVVLDQEDLEGPAAMGPVRVPEVFQEHEPGFLPSRESLPDTSRLSDQTDKSRKPTESVKLDGLLTISSKALQSREKSSLVDPSDPATDRYLLKMDRPLRPTSSFNSNRPVSVRADAGRQVSARARGGKLTVLAPIEGRVRTPSVEDDRPLMLPNTVIRGTGLNVSMLGMERLNSPPLPLARNGALPPLSVESEINSQLNIKKKVPRASSAIHHNKEARLNVKDREKTVIGYETGRPSTTHAVYHPQDRSETPFGARRSSTPMGANFNSLRLSHNTGGASSNNTNANLNMKVKGNSINPQTDGTTGMNELEETEEFDDIVSTKWDPPYRRLIHSSVVRNFEGANLHSGMRRTRQPPFNTVR